MNPKEEALVTYALLLGKYGLNSQQTHQYVMDHAAVLSRADAASINKIATQLFGDNANENA